MVLYRLARPWQRSALQLTSLPTRCAQAARSAPAPLDGARPLTTLVYQKLCRIGQHSSPLVFESRAVAGATVGGTPAGSIACLRESHRRIGLPTQSRCLSEGILSIIENHSQRSQEAKRPTARDQFRRQILPYGNTDRWRNDSGGGRPQAFREKPVDAAQMEIYDMKALPRPRESNSGGIANGQQYSHWQTSPGTPRFTGDRRGATYTDFQNHVARPQRNGVDSKASNEYRLPRRTGWNATSREQSLIWDAQLPKADISPKDYDNRWAQRMQSRLGVEMIPTVSMPAIGMMVKPESRQEAAQKPVAVPKELVLPADVTVQRLAQELGINASQVEEVLESIGEELESVEERVSMDAAELVAAEFNRAIVWGQSSLVANGDVQPRPAVVTVMGHVDHGKTTLLDALRKTSVAASEAGGITQHIGAFEVKMPGCSRSLTFLDTPGHAAFKAMRARGAKVTDLVILVVAADDGVMPQTREAWNLVKDCGCPLVVAISKCDLPQADIGKVKRQLAAEEIELEEYGGNVQVVEISAKTGKGLIELEEAMILQADVLELMAAQDGCAEAVVVEAHMEKGLGPVATVIVKKGTLHNGDAVVLGTNWGKIRTMKNSANAAVDSALPGQPVEICGLRGVPQAGESLMVVRNEERAKRVIDARAVRRELAALAQGQVVNGINGTAGHGSVNGSAQTLNIVLKADTKGTAEAVRDAILQLRSAVVGVQVLYAGVGPVTDADITFAAATHSRIFAFNVKMPVSEEAYAKEQNVDVHEHSVIYHLLDDVGERLIDLAPPLQEEVIRGEAEVLKVFQLKGKRGHTGDIVAGCKVVEGRMDKKAPCFKVVRNGKVVSSCSCASLHRQKQAVEMVGKGNEFGAVLEGFSDFRQGDVIQCVIMESRRPRTESVLGGGLRILEAEQSSRESSHESAS